MSEPSITTTTYKPAAWFWASRQKGPSTAGGIIFIALRLLDLPFQYYLLHSPSLSNLITRITGTALSPSTLPSSSHDTILDLPPYLALIFILALGSAAKQIYWRVFICDTVMPADFSTLVAVYNTALNTINTSLAIWSFQSQYRRDSIMSWTPLLLGGVPLYALGLFVEWYGEVQRKAFKLDPRNAGKPFTGGLFGLARNINYGGYTLWRTGYAMVCGGWVWAAVTAAWLAGDFCSRAIPSMDAYCEQRYGVRQWAEVRVKVPYRLLPWVW